MKKLAEERWKAIEAHEGQGREKVLGSYLPPGTRVRYDGTGEPEYGIVVQCWINDEIQAYDCYIAFFGERFPEAAPNHIPYILRYSSMSLTAVRGYTHSSHVRG